MSIIKDYIHQINESCGKHRNFIVILRSNKKDEAIRKILLKTEEKIFDSPLFTKIKIKNKEVNIYRTGKILIKNMEGKEELEKFLEEILKD
jgi:ribonuclease HIII